MPELPIPQEAVDPTLKLLGEGVGAAAVPAAIQRVAAALVRKKNVVLYGPPGTGKTRAAFEMGDVWVTMHGPASVFRITFHPSYAYEDFVHGFRPKTEDPSTFSLQDGILIEACQEAWNRFEATGDATGDVLLIIDEINRADVARVFGELITFLEPDKRGQPFRFAQLPSQAYAIPPNLYILGTMNSADKSVSLLDVALRRRFAFLFFPPDPQVFDNYSGWLSEVEGVRLGPLLTAINERLAREGIEPDRGIGHALLGVEVSTPDPSSILRQVVSEDIVPLVQEYFYMDRHRVRAVLGDLVDDYGNFEDALSDEKVIRLLRRIADGETDEVSSAPPTGAVTGHDESDLPPETADRDEFGPEDT